MLFRKDLYLKRGEMFTQEHTTKVWSDAAGKVQKYTVEMIQRWKLTRTYSRADLFSAVLTAFNVESYLLLPPSPPDPSITILQQLSSQLASFSISPPFVNFTQPSSIGRTNAYTRPPVPRWAVWLNTLRFSTLILSLTSVFIVIVAKQWLNEYSSGASGTSRPIARLRQY